MPLLLRGSGGGGFEVGSSYLYADTAQVSEVASDAQVNQALTLNDSAGADFAIDGMDNTLINVLNDCWAVIYYYSPFTPSTDTITGFYVGIGSTPSGVLSGNFDVSEESIKSGIIEFPITTLPVPLSAGTTLNFYIGCTTSAGTWQSIGSLRGVRIVRV